MLPEESLVLSPPVQGPQTQGQPEWQCQVWMSSDQVVNIQMEKKCH